MENPSHAINYHRKEIAKLSIFYFILNKAVSDFNRPIFSCSMDMTTASLKVIQATMKGIQYENKKPSDREITKIEFQHAERLNSLADGEVLNRTPNIFAFFPAIALVTIEAGSR